MVLTAEDRNIDFLKAVVQKIYKVMVATEHIVAAKFPQIVPNLPKNIHFVHTEELETLFPELTPRERENAVAK